jgi:hypothetical protein
MMLRYLVLLFLAGCSTGSVRQVPMIDLGDVKLWANAARIWRVPVEWFENSGHFVYFEQPDVFSKKAIEFLNRRPAI